MFAPEFQARLTDTVRVVVARSGEDPRLVERVVVSAFPLMDMVTVEVVLRDQRRWTEMLEGSELSVRNSDQVKDVVASVAMKAAGYAYAQPVPVASGFAVGGLASDGWWREVSLATADAGRRWVRDRLLGTRDIGAAAADRFIASLDPPKREELLRRAVDDEGVEGF